jgi:poly(3-hydroxybutyrate) depolymerase
MGRLAWIVLVFWGLGCADKAGPGSGAEDEIAPADDSGAADAGDDTGEATLPLANGLYLLGFNVAAVAGLVVPLQVEIAMSVDEDGQRRIDSFIIRATDGVDAVSGDLAVTTDLVVSEDGQFEADLPQFTLPGEFSPTSNPVEIDSLMSGTIVSESFFCGDVSGSIVSFDMDLGGSSFGSLPWADRILGAPMGCEETTLEDVPRLVDCPVLSAGRTTSFGSGDLSREVEIVLPEDHSTDRTWPLLIALHGIGSDIDAMVDGSGLREAALSRGMIVVAPQALERGGTAAWDPVGVPGVNLDIVLIDDLLHCVSQQFSVDPDRVSVTGMSLGGIMTATLLSTRSEAFGSAMPFSGGFMTSPSADTLPIPTLVSWGGADDTYYGQDFDALSRSMSQTLSDRGHAVVVCNHGTGHNLESSFWEWALQFMEDHPRGTRELAYSDGLPAVYPDYCETMSLGG